MFCEPASAASVAGLIKYGVEKGSRVVCTLTGHGLKDPDVALSQIALPVVVDPTFDAILNVLSIEP